MNWIDFTRRNDPATQYWVDTLNEKLIKYGYPKVLCFWTKAPNTLADLYGELIADIRKYTLILAQVTINNYTELETLTEEQNRLNNLVKLLGADHIRLRLDPIIPSYTKREHFQQIFETAHEHGIDTITTNFIVPSYKGVGALLAKQYGITIPNLTIQQKASYLNKVIAMADCYNIKVRACAELNRDGVIPLVPKLVRGGCADYMWAEALNPNLKGIFTINPSRLGCLCCYDGDWGAYRNNGAPACVHNCAYCYAK